MYWAVNTVWLNSREEGDEEEKSRPHFFPPTLAFLPPLLLPTIPILSTRSPLNPPLLSPDFLVSHRVCPASFSSRINKSAALFHGCFINHWGRETNTVVTLTSFEISIKISLFFFLSFLIPFLFSRSKEIQIQEIFCRSFPFSHTRPNAREYSIRRVKKCHE